MTLRSADFKSAASANFAIRAEDRYVSAFALISGIDLPEFHFVPEA